MSAGVFSAIISSRVSRDIPADPAPPLAHLADASDGGCSTCCGDHRHAAAPPARHVARFKKSSCIINGNERRRELAEATRDVVSPPVTPIGIEGGRGGVGGR